jgi:biopolymer transport protein ExbD
MSHGGGGEGGCEPNLTPLLDLVLQILMFFIVTVNFASEANAGQVPLPESQTARPIPKDALRDPVFVNLLYNNTTRKHEVVLPLRYRISAVTGKQEPFPPMTQAEARRELQKLYEDLSRAGEVKNQVIIRAHRESEYNEVFQVLQSCSDAGFRNLNVRALVR